MSLQRFCRRAVITLSPTHTIADACNVLQEQNIGCIVVEDGGKLCGILTDRDIALQVGRHEYDPRQTAVKEIMTTHPTSIPVDRTLHDLTALMHREHVRRVPIVDEEQHTIGLVTLDDLLMLLSEEFSDMSQGISAALFGRPQKTEEEVTPPFGWLMSSM